MVKLRLILTLTILLLVASTAGIAIYVQAQHDNVPVVRDESTVGWNPDWLAMEGFGEGGGKVIELEVGGIDAYLANIYLLMPVPLVLAIAAWVGVDILLRRRLDGSEYPDDAACQLGEHVDQHG